MVRRLLGALLFPSLCLGDAFLCVGEKGAGVERGASQPMEAKIYNVSTLKWLLTNESGKWQVKELGEDTALFDECSSEFYCERARF